MKGENIGLARSIKKALIIFLFFFAGIDFGAGAVRPVDLGEITYQSGRAALGIAVASTKPAIRERLEFAFRTHGGYVSRTQGRADFTFRVEPVEAHKVSLVIESGQPARELFKATVVGGSREEAVLRAGDLAVSKTLGIPGYFAGKLAFIGDRSGFTEIYTADLLFENVRQMTHDRSECLSPKLSPNGKFLLYTSYFRNGFPDIYKIDLGRNEKTVFVSFKGSNSGAIYNPGGTDIALILSGTGSPELYLCDPEGRALRRLTRTERAIEADPTWSPDGGWIAFTSDRLGRPQLFRVAARGGRAEYVRTGISGTCAEPSWNPRDPDQIAFTILRGGEFKIALHHFKEGKSRVLTRGGGDAVEPVWTNDGRHLIYTSGMGRNRQLMLLDSETGKTTPLQRRREGNAFQAHFIYPKGD